jgi:hypothetical protein
MSAASREAIADAASTVAGVNVHPTYRQGGKAGDGNVVWLRNEYPNIFGAVEWWEVQILLPVDIKAAQDMAGELVPQLYAALSEAGALTVTEVSFGTTSQDNRSGQPTIIVTGHR